MNSYNLINPKKDVVFKRIFGKKGNEDILKDLLETILDIEIDSLDLDLNTEIVPDNIEGKTSRIDVLAKLSDGTRVNIEMQMNSSGYSEKRCLKYWSDLYSRSVPKRENYKNAKKTICIWIVNGTVYPEFEKYHSKWKIYESELKTSGFEDLEFHVIELKKFRDSAIMKPEKKEEFWLWFLDHTDEEMIKMACIDNEKIKEARKILDEIYADEKLMFAIIQDEKAERDYISRIDRDKRAILEEGEKNKKIEIAKKLKNIGMPILQIAEITELTEEEIEKL